MGTSQLERQVLAQAKTAASAAVGRAWRTTSLVQQAGRWTGGTSRNSAPPQSGRDQPQAQPAADGYVRRSPVQPLRVMPGYRKRMVLRVIGIAALIVVAGVVLSILFRLGVFI